MNNNGEETKQRILETLKKHPEGLTIQDLSDVLELHRQTVTKYVLVLEALDLVYRRRIGPVTLNYFRNDFLRKAVAEVQEKAKRLRK